MVWLETPTNPMLKIFDIAPSPRSRTSAARGRVDNTFATPVLQSPLALGATAVVHSTTKYLNGHSDVVGGAIVTSDAELAERSASSRTRSAPSPARSTATWSCAA
jgi:cystathionine beta-lyase/cystathionine gamma-synthase